MISLMADYARLFIEKDRPFDEVTDSLRAVLQVHRVNGLRAVIVVSEQNALDWRSSLRVALRFVASGWNSSETRLALVTAHADPDIRGDVCSVATAMGFDCKVFRRENDAIAWARAHVVRG